MSLPGDDAGCARRAQELSSQLRAHAGGAKGSLPERLGPWILGRPLGSGAMGAVLSARHAKSGQSAAVKIAAAGTDYGRLLHQEAVALASLSHRGVVQIHDHGEDHGIVWLALQLVDGESLREWVARRFGPDDAAPLSRDEVRTCLLWMRDLALALHVMHRRGVLHRDVKPGNLMIGADGEARVIDLGLAIDLDGEPVAALAGTAPYMSPEQVLAAALVDARSDLYSLTASFYEVLSGWVLARGRGSLASVLHDVAFAPAPRLSARVPNVLPGVDAVFAKALMKSPAQRYADASQLAEDLDLVLQGRLPKWAKETFAVRWRRRAPVVAVGVVVASLIGWLGAGWMADRAAMQDFRTQCDVAIKMSDTDPDRPGRAISALETALSMNERFAGSQEFEDLYRGALAELAPVLTRWMFRTTALATTADVDGTETGRVGAHAELHLAQAPDLSDATRVELAVQAAFRHVRAMRTKAAKDVLATLRESKRRDERVVALQAMATLWDVWDAERGELKDRAAYEKVLAEVNEVGFDYGNLEADGLCARAMLLLEVAEVAQQVPESAARGTSSSAELQRALASIEAPLENALQVAASSREAGNYVASLLALVRLRIEKPAAARDVLEMRLGTWSARPETEELQVMAMFSAAAGFRALVRELAPACTLREVGAAHRLPWQFASAFRVCGDALVDAALQSRMPILVDRFQEAAEAEPQLTTRFVVEIGRGDSEPDCALRAAFEDANTELLDQLIARRPSPRMFSPAVLTLAWHSFSQWYAESRWWQVEELARIASMCPDPLRATSSFDDVGARVFWLCAIRTLGTKLSRDGDPLGSSKRFIRHARACARGECPESDLAVAILEAKGRAVVLTEDPAVRDALARTVTWRGGAVGNIANAPLIRDVDDVLTEEFPREVTSGSFPR